MSSFRCHYTVACNGGQPYTTRWALQRHLTAQHNHETSRKRRRKPQQVVEEPHTADNTHCDMEFGGGFDELNDGGSDLDRTSANNELIYVPPSSNAANDVGAILNDSDVYIDDELRPLHVVLDASDADGDRSVLWSEECIEHGGVVQQTAEPVDEVALMHADSAKALLIVIEQMRRHPVDASFSKLLKLIKHGQFQLRPGMQPSMYALRLEAARADATLTSSAAVARQQLITVQVRDTSDRFLENPRSTTVPTRSLSSIVQAMLEREIFDGHIAQRPIVQMDSSNHRIVDTAAFSPAFEETFALFAAFGFVSADPTHLLLVLKVFGDKFELHSLNRPHPVMGVYVQLLGRASMSSREPNIYTLALGPPRACVADMMRECVVNQVLAYKSGREHIVSQAVCGGELRHFAPPLRLRVFVDVGVLAADFVGRVEMAQALSLRGNKNSPYDHIDAADCASISLQPLIDRDGVEQPPCEMRTVASTLQAYDVLKELQNDGYVFATLKTRAARVGLSIESSGMRLLDPPALFRLVSFGASFFKRIAPDLMHLCDLGLFKRILSMVICARARDHVGSNAAKRRLVVAVLRLLSDRLFTLSHSTLVASSFRLPLNCVHLKSSVTDEALLTGSGGDVLVFAKTTADTMAYVRSVLRVVAFDLFSPDQWALLEWEREVHDSVRSPAAGTHAGRMRLAVACEQLRVQLVAFATQHAMVCAIPNVMQLRYLPFFSYFCGVLSEYDNRIFEQWHARVKAMIDYTNGHDPEMALLTRITEREIDEMLVLERVAASGDAVGRDASMPLTGTRFDEHLATRNQAEKDQYGVPTKSLDRVKLQGDAREAVRVGACILVSDEFGWVLPHLQALSERSKLIETTSLWFNGSKLRRDMFVVVCALYNAHLGDAVAEIKASVCRLTRIVDIHSVTFVELRIYERSPPEVSVDARRRVFAAQPRALWTPLASAQLLGTERVHSRLQIFSAVTAVPLTGVDSADLSQVDVVFENEWRNDNFKTLLYASRSAIAIEQLVARYPLFASC